MNRKVSWLVLVAMIFALSHPGEAQQPANVPKIGWLSARHSSVPGIELLRPELRKLGYVDGKNIAFESRYADNKFDRLPALADDLLSLKVEILLTPSTIEALAAKNA